MFDQSMTRLVETLGLCGNRIEEGPYFYDAGRGLVCHQDGDDYPLAEAILESDTVLLSKDANKVIQHASTTFQHVAGVSRSEAIGKPSAHFWPGDDGGNHIDRCDDQVLTTGAGLFRELLKRGDQTLDRVSFRFLLPRPLHKFGRLAVICFNKNSGLKRLEETKWPNPKPVASQQSLALEQAHEQVQPPEPETLIRKVR
jgi:hypothetical protein